MQLSPALPPLHCPPAPPRPAQTGTFRLDGFILRDQVGLLLAERVYCDKHGRYLQPPPQGEDAASYEARLARAMATRLQRRDSSAPLLAALGARELRSQVSAGAAAAALAAHPSPFDNQAVAPHLNLAPFMSAAPMAVRLDTPATRCWAMLVSLSLRWGRRGARGSGWELEGHPWCPFPAAPFPERCRLPVALPRRRPQSRHIVVVDQDNHAHGIITRRDLAHATGSRLARWVVFPRRPARASARATASSPADDGPSTCMPHAEFAALVLPP